MQPERDPSRESWYVGDEFYRDLAAAFTDWAREDKTIADPGVRDRCRAFLEREARILDERRFEDWLALFAPECLYWVPGTLGAAIRGRRSRSRSTTGGSSKAAIYRLRTGYAWSQVPASRTTRLDRERRGVAGDAKTRRTWCGRTFLVSEFRAGETRVLSGWCCHRLAERADRLARSW